MTRLGASMPLKVEYQASLPFAAALHVMLLRNVGVQDLTLICRYGENPRLRCMSYRERENLVLHSFEQSDCHLDSHSVSWIPGSVRL